MTEVNENVATLVVVGTWNVSIFTPEWVKENVLIGKDFQILFPVNIMNSLKFVVPNKYSLAVNGNRLEFQLNDNCDVCSKELLEPVRNVLRSLIHTPVSSFGINYVFKTNEQPGLLSTLPHTNEIKDALKNTDVKIIVDCGIATGSDVFKALALGADAAAVGRSMLPSLEKNGSEGVREFIRYTQNELRYIMSFTGFAKVEDINDSVLHFMLPETLPFIAPVELLRSNFCCGNSNLF